MLALAAQPNNHAPHSVLVAVAVVVVRPFVLGVRAIMASSILSCVLTEGSLYYFCFMLLLLEVEGDSMR